MANWWPTSPRPVTLHYTRYMRAHLILDLITRTILGEQYRSLSSTLCSFLSSPVTSSLSSPNTLLNTLFSTTLGVCSSLSVSDQVLHPYKTSTIIVPYTLHFKFLDSKLEDKMTAGIPWLQSALNFFLNRISIRYGCSQIFEPFHPFKNWVPAAPWAHCPLQIPAD